MATALSSNWIQYDHLTSTYRTGDGTVVAGELVDNASCIADVLHIANIRAEQRAATCSCPSGDGSLRWPCPVHPPEQDEDQQTGDASDGCGESPDGSDDEVEYCMVFDCPGDCGLPH